MFRLLLVTITATLMMSASCSSEEVSGLPADSPCLDGDAPQGHDARCEGNRGCTELEVICGECACTLCWNERCVVATCNDGGTDRCPGSPWDSDVPWSSQEL